MNAQMRNIASLFGDSRSRLMIILTLTVIGFALLFSVLKLRGNDKKAGPAVQAVVTNGPKSLESIPFNTKQTPEYQHLQEQQNAMQAQTAAKSGKSAIPTIVGASDFENKPSTLSVPVAANVSVPATPISNTLNSPIDKLPPSPLNNDGQSSSVNKRRPQSSNTVPANQGDKSQIQTAMNRQAGQLFGAWAAPVQAFVQGQPVVEGQSTDNGQNGNAQQQLSQLPLAKAGSITFAVLVTAVNSDEPGPIMAKIVEGNFKGATLLGTLTYQTEKVLLSFNLMNLPSAAKSIPISAVAIDQDTARTSLSSNTDHHYLLRYGSVFASSFMQGYGQAVSSSGATTTTNGLNQTTTNPVLTPKDELLTALGNVGTKFGDVAAKAFDTKPTVYVNSGTALGILFMQDVQPVS